MKLFNIDGYDRSQIEVIVANADGRDHIIATWTGGNPVDSKLEIEISPDKMQAFIIIYPALHGGLTLKRKRFGIPQNQWSYFWHKRRSGRSFIR